VTRQETFDIVARHLLTQNERAAHGGNCYYRLDGLKCAAGILIPDDKYREEFEDSPVLYESEREDSSSLAGEVIASEGHDLILVQKLQNIHDNHDPMGWYTKLQDLAEKENLTFNF
jgi:hypothetical protein